MVNLCLEVRPDHWGRWRSHAAWYPSAMSGLNQKQALFVLEIVKGRSGVEAYRAAGYRGEGHVAEAGASEILKKPG
jgi:hypothetical protein